MLISLHLVQIVTCSTVDVEGLQEFSSTILVLGTCSQMLRVKNKATQKMLNVKVLRPSKHYFP
jgi:hypothetical protein